MKKISKKRACFRRQKAPHKRAPLVYVRNYIISYLGGNMKDNKGTKKLKEFKRWQRISGNQPINYNDNYILELNDYSKPPYTRRERLLIKRECALEELNAIMNGINSIKDIRLRQILILNYIATDKLKDYDIYTIMGKSESWYYPKKKQAIKEFEKTYRGACLIDI